MKFAGVNLDGWIGAVISVVILKAGAGMLAESAGSIMGNRPDAEISKRIRETVAAVPGVLGVHDLVLHDSGPDSAIGSVDVDASLDAAAIHRLTRSVQIAAIEGFRVFLTVGIYAADPARRADAEAVEAAVLRHDGVKSVHGVFFDDERSAVSFDALVEFTVRDRDALRAALAADVAALFPGRSVAVNFDTDYSD